MKLKSIIYWDLDGLIANYPLGAMKIHNIYIPLQNQTYDFYRQMGFQHIDDPDFRTPITSVEFWANLPVLHDGLALFNKLADTVGNHRICILSRASQPFSVEGKRLWIEKHLPGMQHSCCFLSKKELVAAPNKLLVDDFEENTIAFEAVGGKSCLVPRAWNSRSSEICSEGYFNPEQIAAEIFEKLREIENANS